REDRAGASVRLQRRVRQRVRQVAEVELQGRRPRPSLQTALGVETAEVPGQGATKGLHGMSKQVVLLRVGIDAGCGGIQGPMFEDGSFDFVCIPDNQGVSVHTYGNMLGRGGKPLAGYFAEARRKVMAERHVHVDPEFETFTYGDPTPPKRSLRNLKPGDLL